MANIKNIKDIKDFENIANNENSENFEDSEDNWCNCICYCNCNEDNIKYDIFNLALIGFIYLVIIIGVLILIS